MGGAGHSTLPVREDGRVGLLPHLAPLLNGQLRFQRGKQLLTTNKGPRFSTSGVPTGRTP